MFEIFNKWLKQRDLAKLKDKKFAFLFDDYFGDEVVVFDTETTGLNTKKDEIISIGAVIVKGNKILTKSALEIFIKPSSKISKESIKIHRIRECDLQNGINIDEAIEIFLNFIGNRPLVGYYLEFDVAMVNRVVKKELGIKLPNDQIEVSGLYFDYKNTINHLGNIDLRFDKILEDLQLPKMGQHDALNDAIMTAMVYLKLKNIKG
jgi:DNA polymerase III subunit epsilon